MPLITEFLAANDQGLRDGDGRSSDWIEVHNAGDVPLNLGGYHLTDDQTNLTRWQFPAHTLAAGEFLVVFASSQSSDNYVDAGGNLHTNFALRAGGEYVALVAPNGGEVLSQFAADGSDYPPQLPDVSYGLAEDGATAGYFLSPTPGSANAAPPVADPLRRVVISEVMYHPPGANELEEYVEVYNAGDEAVQLKGWRFDDGVDFVFPEYVLNPGAHLAIAADTPTFGLKYDGVTNVVGGWTGQLSNRGERIALVDSHGLLVDAVTYSDEGEWSQRGQGPPDHGHRGWIWLDQHDGGGKSLELVNAQVSNDHGQNWSASAEDEGTPGAVNSVHATDTLPLILDTTHAPVIPTSSDSVTVSARVLDELSSGVEVAVWWRVDGAAGFEATAMSDDGNDGDRQANDRIYTASIPPQANGTVIEFYVQASDQAGNIRSWPAPTADSGQVTNLLYQVDDSFDAHAAWQPTSDPVLRLIMTEAERAELADIGDGGNGNEDNSNAQMNATIIYQDGTGIDVRYNAGIRNRGHGSRDNPPNNYRINLPNDRPWEGVTAINVNSKFTHSQIIGSAIFNRAGVVAPNANAAQVRVNGANLAESGVRMHGAYAFLEVLSGEFADNHFAGDPDGNVYAARRLRAGVEADLAYQGTSPAPYRAVYRKQSNVAEDDWSDLIQLTDVLNNAPAETYLKEVRQVADVQQWLRFLALETLMGNNETSLSRGIGDDYNLYRGEDDARFVLVPHDLDTLFGEGTSGEDVNRSIFTAAQVDGLSRFLTHPDIVPLYYQTFLDLLSDVYTPEVIGPLFDQILGPWIPQNVIDRMQRFMVDRIDAVLKQIPRELTIDSDLPMVDHYYRTTVPTLLLSGMAPVAETRSVTVNGQPVQFDPLRGDWRMGESERETDLVLRSSQWRYLDDGSDQDTAWREPEFADSTWRIGRAQLGYGDNDETTVVSFGPDVDNRHITTYFRHTFHVADPSAYSEAVLRVLRDDGVAVYLNGHEIARDNLPQAAGFDTPAPRAVFGDEEDTFFNFQFDPSLLRVGDNVLAVEVHQHHAGSGDVSFDLALTAIEPRGPGVARLLPGINRVIVQAYDAQGKEIDRSFVDVWYDDDPSEIAGALSGDTTLDAARSPWLVTDDLVVPSGTTLTIEPGVTVYFSPEAGLDVAGRLVAEGTSSQRILLTRPPGATHVWEGLRFTDTQQDNRLAFTDIGHADGAGHSIEVSSSRLTIDHATWFGTEQTIIEVAHPSLLVTNSVFPGISSGEVIHGQAVIGDEFLVFDGNLFGRSTSGGDVVDILVGEGNGPPVRFFSNVFLGGDDDGIDLDGVDALIEGNLFMNFHNRSSRPTTSNAVSTGLPQNGHANRSDITLRRNIFVNNDHHVLLKEDASLTSEHNVYYGALVAAIQFNEIGGTANRGPSKGGTFSGDIFWQNAEQFVHAEPEMTISVDHSIVPLEALGMGLGNIAADPLFVDPQNLNFRLQPDSPGIGTGPLGTDMGAYPGDAASGSGSTTVSGGTLSENTTLNAADGPYLLASDLIVPAGLTLTIEAGTSLFFAEGVELRVRGRLIAEGSEYAQIRFTRPPGSDGTWNGIQFEGSTEDNRISWAVLEFGETAAGMIGLNDSRLSIDHVTFDHSGLRRINATNASLIVRNSTFEDIAAPGQPPLTDNVSEQIHAVGILPGGEFLIEDNLFGTTTGHNDIIDFTGPSRPGPILQLRGNTFHGSGDEILDLGGDAHIEGNLFMHVHRDEFNTDPSEANAISTGDGGSDSVVTIVRNLFYDVDHALNLKNNTFAVFEQNTVVGIPADTPDAEFSAINFLIPGQDAQGRGVYLDGNIFWDVPERIFGHVDQDLGGDPNFETILIMHRTLVQPARAQDAVGQRGGTILDLGEANLAGDPRFADAMSDWSLRPGSPALGAGIHGINLGHLVSPDATIGGEPGVVTADKTALLTVAGPGVTHFRYAVNDGSFGDEQAVGTPIVLSDLADGSYTVRVIGRNSAGIWQPEAEATLSRTWTVDSLRSRIVINEVLANNSQAYDHHGTYPDLIELYNDGALPVDLGGMGISDDPAQPDRFVFPAGTVVAPGQYVTLMASADDGTPGMHLGFSLSAEGEGVYLFASPATGGDLIDFVE